MTRRAPSPKFARSIPPAAGPCRSTAVRAGSCVTTKGLSMCGREEDVDLGAFSAVCAETACNVRIKHKTDTPAKRLPLRSSLLERILSTRLPFSLCSDNYTRNSKLGKPEAQYRHLEANLSWRYLGARAQGPLAYHGQTYVCGFDLAILPKSHQPQSQRAARPGRYRFLRAQPGTRAAHSACGISAISARLAHA